MPHSRNLFTPQIPDFKTWVDEYINLPGNPIPKLKKEFPIHKTVEIGPSHNRIYINVCSNNHKGGQLNLFSTLLECDRNPLIELNFDLLADGRELVQPIHLTDRKRSLYYYRASESESEPYHRYHYDHTEYLYLKLIDGYLNVWLTNNEPKMVKHYNLIKKWEPVLSKFEIMTMTYKGKKIYEHFVENSRDESDNEKSTS